MHSFQEYTISLTAIALREEGKADSSTSPVPTPAPTVLLQLNMPGNRLYLLFISPQGEEPAASSAAQNHFSPVPHTCWKRNMVGWKHHLSVTSHQRRG